jgi:hypothetical protein
MVRAPVLMPNVVGDAVAISFPFVAIPERSLTTFGRQVPSTAAPVRLEDR